MQVSEPDTDEIRTEPRKTLLGSYVTSSSHTHQKSDVASAYHLHGHSLNAGGHTAETTEVKYFSGDLEIFTTKIVLLSV